jgi:hypothetical protein
MNHRKLRSLPALCLLATANTSAAVRYMEINNATPTLPYTSWSTAATNIQDAAGLASCSANPTETHA